MRVKTRLGFEFKRTDAPRMTPSMRSALSDLHLDALYVVHAGEHSFSPGERIRAVPIGGLLDGIRRMERIVEEWIGPVVGRIQDLNVGRKGLMDRARDQARKLR